MTQEDIVLGLKRSFTHDPVCRAIKRAVHKQYRPSTKFQVLVQDRDFVFIAGRLLHLPKQVGQWIGNYDNNKIVEPISFDLDDLPEEIF